EKENSRNRSGTSSKTDTLKSINSTGETHSSSEPNNVDSSSRNPPGRISPSGRPNSSSSTSSSSNTQGNLHVQLQCLSQSPFLQHNSGHDSVKWAQFLNNLETVLQRKAEFV